ncbi:TonB-dependent receptor [Filimonas zeae]|uniref:TonB-dependent receptor n=1 Tax=Filimonas zeae TaxID=1737353 RepID=A0A917J5N1_9BACT|nr:TonB-dependent receptor [Filimonas zeae]MDR6341858.1 TonB-dependent receptor [Filimonas zeae]GGH80060.1 TonB-dependent receptor [Filimonas zeae]
MQKLTTVFLFLLLAVAGYAQRGVLTGSVIDRAQKLSLPGANISLTPGNRYTVSDEHGRFEFLNVPAGDYTLTIDYIGFKKVSQAVTVNDGKAAALRILLEEGATAGKEVIVLSDRLRGQAKALNKQKSNPNITNVVSADQVGRFPDANIGDAIKRIPGITMQNDQGEARDIIIRGMAPELNSVTLNGNRIPSAEGDNRRVQMDLIPSDMIQTIEVNKTLTPDMDADAIGGSVNLVTRAVPNGPRVSATLSGGYSPIRNKPIYNGSLVLGNRYFNNKLGAVVSASYNSNDFGSDNVEGEWDRTDNGTAYMTELQVRKYDVKRVRRSMSAALDYKFNNKHSISFNGMYNWRDDWENRYRLAITNIEPIVDGNGNITGYEGEQRRETKGGYNGGRNKNARLETQRVYSFGLNGEHLLGNALAMDWSANYSAASEKRPHERYILFETGTIGVNEELSDPSFPFVTAAGNVPLSDYELKDLSEQQGFTREGEFGAKLNFRVPLSVIDGQKGRLRFGGRLRIKDKKRENSFFNYEPANEMSLASLPAVNWDGNNFQPGSKYVPGTFISKQYLGGLDLANTQLFEAEDAPDEYLTQNYNAKETIKAGYVRWDQDLSSRLAVIAGVRVEHTSTNYTGNVVEDEETLTGQRNIKNSYTNVLPGVTFRYKANEDFIVRAAATTSIARPNYYALAPYVSTIIGDNEIDAGNPTLKAAYAWNFDLMGEYYFKSVGLISGGVFYKNISNFIYVYRDNTYNTDKFAADYPAATNPIPAGQNNWTYTQSRNGESVNVYGFEVAVQRQLNFLPGVLKGLGVYVNYTYTKSKADGVFNSDGEKRTDVALPGTAPHMFNASLSWENKRFVARLSGNYTASYIDELGSEDFTDRYYSKQFFLDANASYRFAQRFRVFAEANNLTNQPLRYYQGVSNRTMQMEYYRSKFNVGVKFDL